MLFRSESQPLPAQGRAALRSRRTGLSYRRGGCPRKTKRPFTDHLSQRIPKAARRRGTGRTPGPERTGTPPRSGLVYHTSSFKNCLRPKCSENPGNPEKFTVNNVLVMELILKIRRKKKGIKFEDKTKTGDIKISLNLNKYLIIG